TDGASSPLRDAEKREWYTGPREASIAQNQHGFGPVFRAQRSAASSRTIASNVASRPPLSTCRPAAPETSTNAGFRASSSSMPLPTRFLMPTGPRTRIEVSMASRGGISPVDPRKDGDEPSSYLRYSS